MAFALSGGGNLGALQAGAMRALVEAGIEPDLLVGTSVGALNAAFYACRPGRAGCEALVAAWGALRRRDLFRFEPWRALGGFLGARDHLVATGRLSRLVDRWLPIERVEDAEVPFAAVASDALSGEAVVIERGDVATALLASAAIPGLFPPVRHDGRWLIDGSLAAAIPAVEALTLGAQRVFVIGTATAPRRRPPRGAVAMAMNSVALVTGRAGRDHLEVAQRRAREQGGAVWVVPSAEPEAPSPFDFASGGALAELGYRRTARWLEEGAAFDLPPALAPPALADSRDP